MTFWGIYGLVHGLLWLAIAVQLLRSRGGVEPRLTWLLVAAVPLVGPVLYGIFGVNYRQGGEAPEGEVSEGNSLEIITSGLRKRELLMEDLRAARRYIHVAYFRFGADASGREIREILMQKAAQGVQVRFVNNNWCGLFSIPRSYFAEMVRAGVEEIPFTHIRLGWRRYLKHINHQQHRKVVVIDGEVAYTGGMNLNDNYFHRWQDTHMRLTGPVVTALNQSFMAGWKALGGRCSHPEEFYLPQAPSAFREGPLRNLQMRVVESAPELARSPMLQEFCQALDVAREYVYIRTPYFVPPPVLLQSLEGAARRGVDVRLLLPGNVDTPVMGMANRAFYADCLSAGVRISESGGPFVHSKTFLSDNNLTVIGSSNLDGRSFFVNYEIDTLIYGPEVAFFCREQFLRDFAAARALSVDSWAAEYPWCRKAVGAFLRLLWRQL